jgi:N-acetylmuramoyl-L-alanine amidase
MLKSACVFFAAALLLAGCYLPSAKRTPHQPPPPNWDISQDQPHPASTARLPVAVVPLAPPPAPPPPVLQTNLATNSVPSFTEETWIGLDHWAKAWGFDPTERVSLQPLEMTVTNGFQWQSFKLKAWTSLIPLPTFLLHTTNGVLLIQSETQEAYWDDVEIHLGFGPELVQGEPLIHTLDVSKTIEPLLHLPALPATNRTIVIDPDDSMAVRGLPENLRGKGFALDWARRVASLLETNGWTVFLTHTNNANDSLAARAAFADAHRANLFLNLRFDLDDADELKSGLSTCCVTPASMPGEPANLFEETWLAFPNNACDVENWQYGFRLQRALIRVPNTASDGLRRSRSIRILRERSYPAVSVCGGYLSNAHDSALIITPFFRQELAEAVASALQ